MNYLVVGPEASGTHYVMDLLRLNIEPGDEVHHRSMPVTLKEGDPRRPLYKGPKTEDWPVIEAVARQIGFPSNTHVVVCFRHPVATHNGQLRMGWSEPDELADKERRAWKMIGQFMDRTLFPFTISTYESLATAGGRTALLNRIGLRLKKDKEFVDGNAKYWS